ncbi:hypothetical protein [Anaplasma marginale]|uniref:hypothetical protein n=1 Tax=Anaplasma marginale TaxID=770 RepID=UPI0011458C8B|nr:hypothetical protein [Anaplasma marginale]
MLLGVERPFLGAPLVYKPEAAVICNSKRGRYFLCDVLRVRVMALRSPVSAAVHPIARLW